MDWDQAVQTAEDPHSGSAILSLGLFVLYFFICSLVLPYVSCREIS